MRGKHPRDPAQRCRRAGAAGEPPRGLPAGAPLSTGARGLLELAHGLLLRADPDTAGLWPRASALLARQSVEESVARLWEARKLDFHACPMRTQLICLRTYLDDAELAARAGHAWSALSRACHHHPYDLAPTVSELEAWFAVASDLIDRVGQEAAAP